MIQIKYQVTRTSSVVWRLGESRGWKQKDSVKLEIYKMTGEEAVVLGFLIDREAPSPGGAKTEIFLLTLFFSALRFYFSDS